MDFAVYKEPSGCILEIGWEGDLPVGRLGEVVRDVRDLMCYQSQECYILRGPQGESDAQ